MSRFGECKFSSLKNSQVQINFKLDAKTVRLLIQTWKNSREVPKDVSWNHFFFFFTLEKTFFKVSVQIFVIALLDVISLKKILIVFLRIIIQNYDV